MTSWNSVTTIASCLMSFGGIQILLLSGMNSRLA